MGTSGRSTTFVIPKVFYKTANYLRFQYHPSYSGTYKCYFYISINRKIKTLQETVNVGEAISMINGYYLSMNAGVGTSISTNLLTPYSGYNLGIAKCKVGDVFTIYENIGTNAPRLYGFINSNNEIIAVANTSITEEKNIAIAPTNAEYIIINTKSTKNPYFGFYEDANNVFDIDNNYIRSYLTNVKYSTQQYSNLIANYYTVEDVSKYAIGNTRLDRATPVKLFVPYNQNAVSYRIAISKTPDFSSPIYISANNGFNYIYWLEVNKMYWIKTQAIAIDNTVIELDNKVIQTRGVRRIDPLTVSNNMRDLGEQKTASGNKIRQGVVYRSAVYAGRSLFYIRPFYTS